MSRERNDRYIIKYGKFGAYFFDVDTKTDMTLEQVKGCLNAYESLEFKFNRLIKEGKIK